MSETAHAAPPSNDTSAGATPAAVGFVELRDTSEATTDRDDAQLNELCGAPATDASVWYAVQGTGQGVVVDVSRSRYSAGLMVGVGTPGNLQLVTCAPHAVAFNTLPDTTYYVIAIDDQSDAVGNGGDLDISFEAIPPPPKVNISVDPFGSVDVQTGTATISGTYTCTNGNYLTAMVDASQNVGRFTVYGSGTFTEYGRCDGAPHPWAAVIVPKNGKFAGGKSMTLTLASSCGISECGSGYASRTVQLRGGSR